MVAALTSQPEVLETLALDMGALVDLADDVRRWHCCNVPIRSGHWVC